MKCIEMDSDRRSQIAGTFLILKIELGSGSHFCFFKLLRFCFRFGFGRRDNEIFTLLTFGFEPFDRNGSVDRKRSEQVCAETENLKLVLVTSVKSYP